MTPDEIEKDRAPERIWSSLDSFGFRKSVSPYSQTLAKSTEYVRSDLFDALTAENARLRDALQILTTVVTERDDEITSLTAERDAALAGAMRVRKLDWEGHSDQKRSGDYMITPSYGQGPKPILLARGSKLVKWCDTEEEA